MSMAIERSTAPTLLPSRRNRALVQVEDHAVVAAHRIRAIGYVTTAAIETVTQVSMVEAECAKLAPSAALRLAAIGDAGTAVMQQTLLRMGQDLG